MKRGREKGGEEKGKEKKKRIPGLKRPSAKKKEWKEAENRMRTPGTSNLSFQSKITSQPERKRYFSLSLVSFSGAPKRSATV